VQNVKQGHTGKHFNNELQFNYISKVWGRFLFLKEFYYAHQGCIFMIWLIIRHSK